MRRKFIAASRAHLLFIETFPAAFRAAALSLPDTKSG